METGRMAKQASGAVFTVYGDTMVLATVTGTTEPREGIDFFPLTVDYEERFYAVGKIPGGFIKREGRPSEKAILTSRIIDRPIRPLFPKGYRNDVQIVTTVLSVDQDSTPDMTALIGASAALHISDIPFMGPIGSVIVGRVGGEFIINPTVEQAALSDMHIAVAGTKEAVNMVEASALEVPEEEILEAIMFGHEEIKRIVSFIEEFRAEALALGLAREKIEFVPEEPAPELEEKVSSVAIDKISEAVHKCAAEKMLKADRENYLKQIKSEIIAQFEEEYPEDLKMIATLVKYEKKLYAKIIARKSELTEDS